MPKKPDKSLLLKAAQLLANGLSEEEVAKTCERSRSWVQAIKRNSDFQKQVEELRQEKKQAFEEKVKEVMISVQVECASELLEYREELRQASKLIVNTSKSLLAIIKERVETLEPRELQASKISQTLKNTSEAMRLAFEMGHYATGVDSLVEEINDFKASSLKGFEATRGYQPFGDASSRN